jgi:hypothetical protein
MLHNEDGVYELSQRQVKDIVKNSVLPLEDLLEKVTQFKETGKAEVAAAQSAQTGSHLISQSSCVSPSSVSASRRAITKDDIIDLRIDLATCRDSLDFIRTL